jgi:hypothetical protein
VLAIDPEAPNLIGYFDTDTQGEWQGEINPSSTMILLAVDLTYSHNPAVQGIYRSS